MNRPYNKAAGSRDSSKQSHSNEEPNHARGGHTTLAQDMSYMKMIIYNYVRHANPQDRYEMLENIMLEVGSLLEEARLAVNK